MGLIEREHFSDALRKAIGDPVPSTPSPTYRHFPRPWVFKEEGVNGGPGVMDANGSCIAALFWPSHPVEETAEAEQETYQLGKKIAELAGTATPVETASPETFPEIGEVKFSTPHDARLAKKLCEELQAYDLNKIRELESQLTQVRSEVSRLERSQESLNSKLYQESKELTQVREELRIVRNEVL